ncbi:MAG: OmpA family protein, partial [Myxococcales bacterium]|nr:OmpA family protein [Myxococcales bacterium]
ERHAIVQNHLIGYVGGALGLFDRFVVFAGLPVDLWMAGGDNATGLPLLGADGTGVGDPWIGGRARLLGENDDPFSLGASLSLTLPLAEWVDEAQRLAGEDGFSARLMILPELRTESFWIGAELGVLFRSSGSAENLEYGPEMLYTLGAGVPLHGDALTLHLEAIGRTSLSDFLGRESSPVELLLGGRYRVESGITFGLAAGPGISRGRGAPDVHVLATLGYVQPPDAPIVDSDGDGLGDEDDRCPSEPEDPDSFEDGDGCPDLDNDGDGVLDEADGCPLEPEDADGFEDEDGCPDLDNDGDGVADAADGCALEPEDADSFEDGDGCPDPDNDQDGVLDEDDRCPLEVGPARAQGCPEPDGDGDGVVDREDNCPREPGPVENRGCQAEQLVRIEDNQLQILDVVHFRTNRARIERRSFGLLENVARVILGHPEIGSVRVEGHTDRRGSTRRNLRLSQERAEAVVRFLVQEGVDASRLEARGFGPERPLVPDASTPEDHARNRRVEFHLEALAGVERRASGPGAETIDR